MYSNLFIRKAHYSIHVIFSLMAIIVLGCTKTIEPNSIEFGYDYYPYKLGDTRIYYTQTISYNLDGSIDTLQYLVKEVVEDSTVYSDGLPRLILGRFSTELGNDNWEKDSIWAVLKDERKVVVSEANIDFVKMSFPTIENQKWDGNALNGTDPEFYELIDFGKEYSYDTLSFSNSLTVVHKDLRDPAKITEDDYRIEVFAQEVGLVHRLKVKINYCSNCVENGTIESGYIFEQKLIEFAKN